MEELITAADKFWVIYDSDNDNVVVGLLMESLDTTEQALHLI